MNNNPYSRFFPLLLGLLMIVINVSAAKTKISGIASSYSGDEIVFLTYTNMISFNETELCRCQVDDSGSFECTFELNEIKIVFTYLGVYNCFFYAEPGLSYNIRLPQKRPKTQAEELNPYLEPTSVHLAASQLESLSGNTISQNNEELNFIIRAFNDSFYPYYYKYVINAYADNVNKKELDQVVETITMPFEEIQHPFLRTYMKYRIGLLQHYGSQQSAKTIAAEYFRSSEIFYNNPAYMELFNEVFAKYFDYYSGEYPETRIDFVLNRENSYSKTYELLKKDPNLANNQLLELVLLKALYEGFYESNYSRTGMLLLLDSIQAKSRFDIHKEMSADIKKRITKLLPGYEPPDLAMYDKDSNLVTLDDFTGQYVYLGFCNSFSYSCIKEFELLRDLNNRHKEHLRIITILVDESYIKMIELISNNKYDWTFLHYSNQPDILDDYDIRTYPTYYLIGPDGKLLLSPAPSPAENFEMRLLQIMRAKGDI